jgi:SAM-dependent methyltransferase
MAPSSTFDPVEFKQNIRTEWRSAADGWRRWLDVVEGPEGGQRHSARLIELAELRPGDRVLDVGGGYGEPSLSAARVVGPEGRVVCTDISAEMLATARERADAASLSNIEFIESDAEELVLEEGSFAAVLSRATLMFLPDVAGTLKRLHRFLEPGGRLAASVWGSSVRRAVRGGLSRGCPRTRAPASAPGTAGSVRAQRSRGTRCARDRSRVPRRRDGHASSDLRDGVASTVH